MNFDFLTLYSSIPLNAKIHHKKHINQSNIYIHWLSVLLASLQVLDVLDVDDGFRLPDLSSWSEHFCKDDNLKSRSRR